MMMYRLEEQLPLEAEELTAVFLPSIGGRCLALSVRSEKILEIVSGLSAGGIEVGPICPTALLSLWACLQRSDAAPNYAIICHGDATEIFRIADNVPHDWYSSADSRNLLNSLRISLLNYPVENGAFAMLAGQLDKDTLAGVEREISVTKIEDDENFFEKTAALGASLLLAGKPAGWVNFRTGKLARKKIWNRAGGLMRTAVVLSMLLVVVLAASFITRGVRYDGLVSKYQSEQNEAYRKLFPSQKIPKNVTSRLESELRRLSGVLGHGQDVPEAPKALDELYAVIKNIPDSLRFRILKIQIGPDNIYIEGCVKCHSDAEIIVQSLQKSGLDAPAPRTERLASGDVSFKINAKPVPEKTPAMKARAKR